MKPSALTCLRSVTLAALAVACAIPLHASDAAKATAAGAGGRGVLAATLDLERQVEDLVRYAMPGPHHQLLDRLAGSWETTTRYWMKAGLEPAEAKGTCLRRWILGGRFLMEELEGGNLALPFRGVALFGYDAFEEKYTSAWVDTMNTAITTNLGTYDPTGDAVTFAGVYKDPWTGSRKPERGVLRFQSPQQHTLELFVQEPGGDEFKMLEITYSRTPAAPDPAPAPKPSSGEKPAPAAPGSPK